MMGSCSMILPYFRRQILAPALRIDCGGTRTEARRPGAIIQVSSDGSWERSGGHGGSEKLGGRGGAGCLLKVFGSEILLQDN